MTLPITNAIVTELHRYRAKAGARWHVVRDMWWPNIFKSPSPPLGTIQSSWSNINTKRQQLRREPLAEFLNAAYSLPEEKPAVETVSSDDSDDDLEFYPDSISPETLDQMGDCMELLTDLWHDEVAENEENQRELKRVERALEQAKQINYKLNKEMSTL